MWLIGFILLAAVVALFQAPPAAWAVIIGLIVVGLLGVVAVDYGGRLRDWWNWQPVSLAETKRGIQRDFDQAYAEAEQLIAERAREQTREQEERCRKLAAWNR